ncbi:MAG: IS5 family transposase [Anaerolineales bacterium]|nr:IS5 family transposase [Anaerolineales bacterium]
MPKRERRPSALRQAQGSGHRCYPTNEPTDLTDAQWAAIALIVTTSSPKGGRPTEVDLRAIVNALIYKNRTGCQWRMLPADVPPMSAVRSSFDKWKRDGTFVKLNDTLRTLARTALGRDEAPSISGLDSQSAKATEAGGERGDDGGKKVNGCKRQCWVDTNVFLLRVLVYAADSSDTEGAEWLLAEHYHCFPRMEETRVDKGYKAGFDRWLAQHTSIRLNVIEQPLGQKGCAVIPKRWAVR